MYVERYDHPKVIDKRVARFHIVHVWSKLIILSKMQSDNIGIEVEGPYKPDTYRY